MKYEPSAMRNHPSAHAGFTKIYVLELVGGEVSPAFAAEFPGAFANMKMWFAVIRRKE